MSTRLRVRVGVEWVNTFPPVQCHQANLDYTDDQTNGFYNTMGSRGHDQIFNWGNEWAWETDFRHPDFGGHSLTWVENVNFVFFDSHGGNRNNTLQISFASMQERCTGSSPDWRLGSGQLKWIAFAGCEAVLNHTAAHVVAVWGGPMQGVHIVMGYIGDSADAWWTRGLGEDVANDVSDGSAIAGVWCDRAYSFWTGDAAIAIAAGASQAEAINRRDHETLDWRDVPVAATSWLAWKWQD